MFDDWQAGGFQQFAGADVSFRVPFSEAVINSYIAADVLPRIARLRRLDVSVHADNRLTVVVALTQPRWLPNLTLPLFLEPDVGPASDPCIRLRITGTGMAGTLAPFLSIWKDRLPPGIEVDGRVVDIRLAQAIQDPTVRLWLSRVRELRFSSVDGMLWVAGRVVV